MIFFFFFFYLWIDACFSHYHYFKLIIKCWKIGGKGLYLSILGHQNSTACTVKTLNVELIFLIITCLLLCLSTTHVTSSTASVVSSSVILFLFFEIIATQFYWCTSKARAQKPLPDILDVFNCRIIKLTQRHWENVVFTAVLFCKMSSDR